MSTKKAKLIFIYGPPASGKLSIAKKLAKKTDIALFHNHLTFDLACTVYKVWSKPFYDYCETLRLDAIKRALENKQSIIFTFCYIHKEDLPFVKKIQKIAKQTNSDICFVQLKTKQKVLNQRVVSKSRMLYSKIHSIEELKEFSKKNNYFEAIPKSDSLSLNTKKNSIKKSVQLICEHFNL